MRCSTCAAPLAPRRCNCWTRCTTEWGLSGAKRGGGEAATDGGVACEPVGRRHGAHTRARLPPRRPTELPGGLFVANDANRVRLMTAARRLRQQRRGNVMLLGSDGRHFPSLRKRRGYKVQFDRVLCDVPCSGDGILRKKGERAWADWKARILSPHSPAASMPSSVCRGPEFSARWLLVA